MVSKRYIFNNIQADLGHKLVLISGPRQVGKTTLAQSLVKQYAYVNFDVPEQRRTLIERSWRRDVDLVIFDELHKMKGWKAWLKGIYDGEGLKPAIVVTGSARLDIARRMGDSLAGRHFLYRLHPLDLKELSRDSEGGSDCATMFERLITVGGFPEPFFSSDPAFPERWRRGHQDIVLRQDVLDLEQIRQITQLETLVELLRDRVGSIVSAQSLSEDLGVNDTTVRRWLTILENLFMVFKVVPWHRNITRSLKKAPKYYFFDNGLVRGDQGAVFENAVACAIFKEIQYQRDTAGRELELRYLRNRDGDELDFAIIEKARLIQVIEAKWADDTVSRSFRKLLSPDQISKDLQAFQITRGAREQDHPSGVKVREVINFLKNFVI